MIAPLLKRTRDLWLIQAQCPARGLLDYMRRVGKLREVQIDALSTYLYLKLGCGGKPLKELYAAYEPEAADLASEEPERRTLAQVVNLAHKCGCLNELFYNIDYPDYLFALPMGAGKTFLMAAIIYLNLYFALSEPENPLFAHNFLVLAPSGTKSSIVPSLRTIQAFDPVWVLPPESAKQVRALLSFEVLDQNASAARSNRTRNPNAQKVASHAPLPELMGLVAVVNAEKVILDHLPQEPREQGELIARTADEREQAANELRALLGKLPQVALLVDEAHHVPTAMRKSEGAVLSEIRLRQVIHRWARGEGSQPGNVREVLGFSGTPYLDKADAFPVIGYKTFEMTNVVHHFPLGEGIGRFLKRPVVREICGEVSPQEIVANGVRDFLATYRNTRYANGLWAKLAIYAGTIQRAEEVIAPQVRALLQEAGLPERALLIHHQGNKDYPLHPGAAEAFATLDRPENEVRIIILVQIGKEGWDCRSLTGVILSQAGDCNRKMVLQTACRCLREVCDAQHETAHITLNAENAKLLTEQLEKQHHLSVEAFQQGSGSGTICREDRRAQLGLQGVTLPFRQLRVFYTEEPTDVLPCPAERLAALDVAAFRMQRTLRVGDFERLGASTEAVAVERREGEAVTFWQWRCLLLREGANLISMAELSAHLPRLRELFEQATEPIAEGRRYRTEVDQAALRAAIRRAFAPTRELAYTQSWTLERASLLTNFRPEELRDPAATYLPDEKTCAEIRQVEARSPAIREQFVAMARQMGYTQVLATVEVPQRTYHLMPYRVDSNLERAFFEAAKGHHLLRELDLLLLYNGERAHTDFRIECYERSDSGAWRKVGFYTPDFIFLQKRGGRIAKALIVETKGRIYANDAGFRARRAFMEQTFLYDQAAEGEAPRYAFRVYDGEPKPDALDAFISEACTAFFSE